MSIEISIGPYASRRRAISCWLTQDPILWDHARWSRYAHFHPLGSGDWSWLLARF